MADKKKKGIVNPANSLIWKGTTLQFRFTVDDTEVEAEWSLSQPEIGKINSKTGYFEAADEFRYGLTEVIANSVDGKSEGSTQVRIMVGEGLANTSIYFADDFMKIPTLKWNDARGRRAAKLILDALSQLPKKFLDKVGQVALIRTDWLGDGTLGMHLPLPGRIILLAEGGIKNLSFSKDINADDIEFVDTVIHEMSHCVLANECLSDFDRWLVILTLAASVGASSTFDRAGLAIISDITLILSRYYANPWAQKDLAYRFAEKAGWQVRDPNPLALFWGGKVPPNVITGYRFIGPVVGLENKFAPKSEDDEKWKDAGFNHYSSGQDLHEDFAETVTAALLGGTNHARLINNERYRNILELLYKEDILPRNFTPVEVGNTILGYSIKKNKPADFEEFGVFLGLYSGKATTVKTSAPPEAAAKSKQKTARRAMKVSSFGANNSPETAGSVEQTTTEKSGAPMAEGYAEKWDQDEAEAVFDTAAKIGNLQRTQQNFTDNYGSVIENQRELFEKLPFGIREGSTLELLRVADCHGTGLQFVGKIDAGQDQPSSVIEKAEPGDMLFDSNLNWWLVARTDSKGRATEIIGSPQLGEEDKLSKGFDTEKVIYRWHPSVTPRIWIENQKPADIQAFVNTVRLWGNEMSPKDYSLFKTGSFITQIGAYFGLRLKDITGEDDRTVLEFAGRKGHLSKTGESRTKDFIRFKNGLWAFVLNENPLEIIIQGGGRGLMCEEESAAKILHIINKKQVTHIWRLFDSTIL